MFQSCFDFPDSPHQIRAKISPRKCPRNQVDRACCWVGLVRILKPVCVKLFRSPGNHPGIQRLRLWLTSIQQMSKQPRQASPQLTRSMCGHCSVVQPRHLPERKFTLAATSGVTTPIVHLALPPWVASFSRHGRFSLGGEYRRRRLPAQTNHLTIFVHA